ncbi:EamA family transporter [Streptomyces thermolilacinus]|uniref:EamA family transporter n=1 Tax=Streptomyces thermolilacinus TaxID=285540 RepID=UPI0033C26A7D
MTLGAAVSWALGNVANKIISRDSQVTGISLVVWSALVAIVPFFACSLLFEGVDVIRESLLAVSNRTMWALVYLALFATIFGYAAWGYLLGRYEAWRIAPLSLLVPVVGIISANLLLGEALSGEQVVGAFMIVFGLLLNTFSGFFSFARWGRG